LKYLVILLVLITGMNLASCKKDRLNNESPVAVAGADQEIVLPIDSTLLDGLASFDADGKIAAWKWSKIEGPANPQIRSANSARTMVKDLTRGVYLFELQVTDDKGASARDTVKISVNSAVSNNKPPVACVGDDQVIELPANTAILDGRCSTDPDNNIAGYLWTKISGPFSYNIINATFAQTEVNNLEEGTYLFQLKATDTEGDFTLDTVQVTVKKKGDNSVFDVYISGISFSRAVYWKNGITVQLPSRSTEASANSIVVVGKDVYVAGEEGDFSSRSNNIAKYWKNGQEVLLTGPTGAGANSIAVDGADIYIAGWEYQGTKTVAKYWKNGQAVSLTDGTEDAQALSISVAGGDVYVAGRDGSVAKYWKNGQPVSLTSNGDANCIAISGSNVYVAGEERFNNSRGKAAYWRNGQGIIPQSGPDRSVATGVAVDGGQVYVAGYEAQYANNLFVGNAAKYWKDGQMVSLSNYATIATSIAVSNGNVYVSGFNSGITGGARYWVNGREVSLPGSRATSVFLVPR
jgi:hypothetical protein